MPRHLYSQLSLPEQSAPASPDSGFSHLYVDTAHRLHHIDSTGLNTYLLGHPGQYETVPRALATFNNTTLVSGRLNMVGVLLPARFLVSSISFMSATTALSGGTHAWFALFDANRNLLRQSLDDTTPSWAANTIKSYSLQSGGYTITTPGLYYLGVMVAATTVPTIMCFPSVTNNTGATPILSGNSTTGLTTTAPNPAAAITAITGVPYALAA